MKKTLQSIAIVFVAIMLSSCSAVFITENSKDPGFSIADQKSKSASVTGFEPVNIKEFVKTFAKKYSQNQDYSTEYANKFKNKLKTSMLFATVVSDPNEDWRLTRSGSFAASDLKAIDSAFGSCKTDFMITVSDFEVGNRIERNYTGPSGPNNMGGTSSSVEFCVIDARFTVFDVKSRKKVLEFTSRGEQSVVLFGFENAFNGAVDSSIEHAVEYLKTGKKEFPQ